MKKVRRIAENIIIICLVCIMGLSLYKIYDREHTLAENRKVYQELPSKDFESLKKINPDTVGWLEFEPFEIDLPIVQGEDNDEYLDHLIDGSYGPTGTLFVDHICEQPFRQFNTVVYGHHMFNGTMFGKFGELKDKEYAQKHDTFRLYTEDGVYDLRIWAFMNVSATDDVYATNIYDDEDKEKYLNHIREEAEYTIGDATTTDRLVCLSTCAYEYRNARYILITKMVKAPPRVITIEAPPKKSLIEKIKERIKKL